MNSYFTQVSRYFRQSLIDADRLCPEDKDILPVLGTDKDQNSSANYLALDNSIWDDGRIDRNLAYHIIRTRQPKNKPDIEEIEVVLFPRVDHLNYDGGTYDYRKRKVLLPLVIFANLSMDGELTPTLKAPWIPRIWVSPSQGAVSPFTEMSLLDEFLTLHPFEGISTWEKLKSYCARLLTHATGSVYREKTDELPATELSEVEISKDYTQSNQCLLQLDSPVVGAKVNLMKVLDFLIEHKNFPQLYQRYIDRSNVALKQYRNKHETHALAKMHLGQMTGEFPLSVKQRNALHHSFEQGEGEILAVNGPPGTGKTTLLRSVVANLWTRAALDQSEPPLIVATSNNNQAVTNILESFSRIDESGMDEAIIGRWLPEVDSYGLYFCSSGKANQSNPYRYAGPRGTGCMDDWQTQRYMNDAEAYFVEHANKWSDGKCSTVGDAIKLIHNEMQAVESNIKSGFELLEKWQNKLKTISEKYGSFHSLEATISGLNDLIVEQQALYEQERQLLDEVYNLWDKRGFWTNIFLWWPSVRRKENNKTSRLLNANRRNIIVTTDKAVEEEINKSIFLIKHKISLHEKERDSATKDLNAFSSCQKRLDKWLSSVELIKLFSKSKPEQVAELNDRYHRFKLFKLATHYYEGRWLEETLAFVEANDKDKKSPIKLLRKLRRYAKLTPCFVSTFYMLPNTFMAGAFKDKTWTDLPQLKEIDLLIVDEAGQALSDISAASFALAKKAMIVGDTDQIEPVWSIPAGVDRSNLALFGLLDDDKDYENWLDSGLLASSGSVMRIAQRQCGYHQFEKLQRGLYLTEHRRCFDEIVGYCNDLVYQGALQPLRGKAKHDVPWGTMAMHPVYSASTSYGGSRGNEREAQVIAQWVKKQFTQIVSYARSQNQNYSEMSDLDVLCKTVGIITPFSKQANLIEEALNCLEIKGLTIGTVHSLQGDERLIVLFSSVYGKNDIEAGKFYDAGHNMLNVAVSRAKDSFIVFGDPDVFGVGSSGLPSSMLKRRLVLNEEQGAQDKVNVLV